MDPMDNVSYLSTVHHCSHCASWIFCTCEEVGTYSVGHLGTEVSQPGLCDGSSNACTLFLHLIVHMVVNRSTQALSGGKKAADLHIYCMFPVKQGG